MEVIDVKEMFENRIEKRKLDLISENIEHSFSMSFYGDRKQGEFPYVDYELYFLPLVQNLSKKDIFMNVNETYYGRMKINHTTFYICNLDAMQEDCNFIDVFGYLSSFKKCENFTLALGDKNMDARIGYHSENVEFYGCGFFFLGRLARVSESAWKFHPTFRQIDYGDITLENHYLHGNFESMNK